MKRKLFLFFVSASFSLLGQAQEVDDVASQLREALRNTTVQLQATRTEMEVVRSDMALVEKKNAAQQATIEKLTKESAAEQAALKENIANLNRQLERKSEEAVRLAAALKEWKDAYEKVTTYARNTEKERAEYEGKLADARRIIELRESQNRALYTIGTEVLDRYEAFGLGKAIKAREPFTGLSRVKIQNLVQDYADDLAEQRVSLDDAETISE